MVQRNLRPIGILLITFFALILCIVMTVAGFWLGRSSMTFTAEQDAVTVEEEVGSVQEDEAEQLIEEAEAEDSSLLPESPADEGDPGAPAEEPASPDEALEAEEFEVEPAEEGETEAPDLEAAETDEVEVEVEDDAAEVESIEERSTEFTPEDLEIIWQEVWPILAEQYDGELPEDDELRHRMIRGMLEALGDRFTRFTPPEAAALSRERLEGSFQGIGAFVRENEEGLVEIVRPIDQQPADRAGLLAGDMIIAVDGMSVTDMTLEEVLPLVRGPEGTEVTLTIRRPTLEEPFDVTIVRALIEIPLVESEMLEAARKQMASLGLELLDVRIKRLNYIDSVRRQVENR
ncbi:MAG: PDZ domain-containing protein, partial [Candidatus Promineifilaceae bacterium]|nr:PDZ domain-containing protein [Candidatus Promineifilaceae bacterium]